MKIPKNTLIAGLIICLALILIFLIFVSLLFRSVVYLEYATTLRITPAISKTIYYNFEATSSPTPNLPGVFSKGMHIYIYGTGGDGLRIREYAGLDAPPLFLGNEGEKFEIIDGPEIVDSIIWWNINSLENPGKSGWAVQNFFK